MYKIIKLFPESAILELAGTHHSLMIPFKKPIDGDIVVSINKSEVITLGIYIGRYLKKNNNINSFYKYNLSSKKNKNFYFYGYTKSKLIFIENGQYIFIESLKVVYDQNIIEKLSHADCQRVGIAIGKTHDIDDSSF